MRQIAEGALSSGSPAQANLVYGKLARRLVEITNWVPDKRADGSPIWMSAVAEGWQPPKREYEWVMVPSLAALFLDMRGEYGLSTDRI